MPVELKVLLACSEVQPLIKTGGLADVAAALPVALRQMGCDVRVLVPGYRGIAEQLQTRHAGRPFQPLSGSGQVRLLRGTLPGTRLPLYLIDAPALYDRPGGPYSDPYGRDYWDNALRFGVLGKVAAMFGTGSGLDGWRADVVHGHDWHCGLSSAYLEFEPGSTAASVFTIHNLAYQGNFDRKVRKALDISSLAFHMDGLEFYGHLSFMKSGIFYADQVTTVSPTYARQILEREYGFGMDGVLRHRAERLTGILNGIDVRTWDPATDHHLPATYDASSLDGKARCRTALLEEMGLEAGSEEPVFAMLGRMTPQKGWDLLLEAAPRLLDAGARLVLVGEGNAEYEAGIAALMTNHPGRVGFHRVFSEAHAHRVVAGADGMLVPSRFEPCGLVQMYGLRYGTPPVAHHTGGLADSVVDASETNLNAGTATGFLFERPEASALVEAALHAAGLRRREPERWRALQRTGMAQENGWKRPAAGYLEVYQNALDGRRSRQLARG